MSYFLLSVLIVCAICARADNNMNQGGVPYSYSNPPQSTKNWNGTAGVYSLQFQENVAGGKVEHFDVYGEVRSTYSSVYWTRNLPIQLPSDLVQRFQGKLMVITGYEVDQVTREGAEPNSSSTDSQLGGFACYPSCDTNGEDKSVPIYNAYNHHYFSWIVGSDAEMYEREQPLLIPNPTATAFRTKNGTNLTFPTSIVFKENPGGEYRKSYHGYPSGFGQLIYSPSQWIVEPMQIDTHNRDYDINDWSHGYVPYVLPKIFTDNNMTDLHNDLSPLIECPCTDRITKSKLQTPVILTNGSCDGQTSEITSSDECLSAAQDAGIEVHEATIIDDSTQITGCSLQSKSGDVVVFYNQNTGVQSCGSDAYVSTSGAADLRNLTRLKIEANAGSKSVTLTMSGPSSVWFGVGFAATVMADAPYAIIVDGEGAVTERKLANHSPGILLNSTITVLSNVVANGIRTVVLQRALKGVDYCAQSGNLNVITAVGSSAQLSYHQSRTAANLTLLPTAGTACLCQPDTAAFITYMGKQTDGFGYDCKAAPRSDMKQRGDGTQRAGISNAACDVETYHGGLRCCKHEWLLTDQAQEALIPANKTDKYFLKWRYYFQEYNASFHRHLHHWVFLIDDAINDYEEDNVETMYGIHGTVGKITANLTVRYIGLEDIAHAAGAATENDNGDINPVPFYANTTITPLVMTPHCHAPSCIREELWNADTGELICNVSAMYGDEKYGSLYDAFNEPNYIAIPPCIFGYQPGLQFPFRLQQNTNLTAVKYFNNTWRHLGQMAQWTGLMAYSTDPY